MTPDQLTIREWPPGHRLFSFGHWHMAFDPPPLGEMMPALFFTVISDETTLTMLACEVFDNDLAALEWFEQQRAKFGHA